MSLIRLVSKKNINLLKNQLIIPIFKSTEEDCTNFIKENWDILKNKAIRLSLINNGKEAAKCFLECSK